MSLTDKTIREICKSAQLRKENGCDVIYCECAKGSNPPSSALYFQIKKGEVCIATDFFSTGHSYLDSYADTEKMEGCPYRNTKK